MVERQERILIPESCEDGDGAAQPIFRHWQELLVQRRVREGTGVRGPQSQSGCGLAGPHQL
jgi:hypothetical protein